MCKDAEAKVAHKAENGEGYFTRREPSSAVGQVHPQSNGSRLSDAGTYQRAKERGQATFTLVAQDDSAPEVIIEWVKANIRTAPRGKLFEALSRAIEFRDFPFHKKAD